MTDLIDHIDPKRGKRREGLWVTDEELIRRSGLPYKAAKMTLRAMDDNPRSGFPRKNPLWGGRRYWPAVEEYWAKMATPQERRRA